jgi:RNA polymerase sigma factor (sigma-70 family)
MKTGNAKKINEVKCYNKKLSLITPHLKRFIHSRISNHYDVEDILQNCLLILFRKRNEYDSNKSFFSWAVQICSFQIKGFLSDRKRRRVNFEKYWTDSSCTLNFNSAPFEPLIESEKIKIFNYICSILSPMEKKIMKLSLKGLSISEITSRLNINRNTYTTHKSRAVSKSKSFLQNKLIKNYTT